MLELMPQATTFYFDAVSQIRMQAWTRGRVGLVGDSGQTALSGALFSADECTCRGSPTTPRTAPHEPLSGYPAAHSTNEPCYG